AHQALRGALSRGREISVVVLERTWHTSYSACGIPYWIAGDVDGADRLVARTFDQHRSLGVDLRLGVTAGTVDLNARVVHYADAAGATYLEPFDELVLATGARPIVPPWARDDAGSLIRAVHPVKNLDDGQAWISLLQADDPGRIRHAVVVGGGYIGL